MLSIIFNQLSPEPRIDMDKKTVFRGNREIFKVSTELMIDTIGTLTILFKNKEVGNISYHITCDTNESVWKQLNLPNNDYVVQVKGIAIDSEKFKLSKIAIQKIVEDKNMLLNI